MTPPTLQQVIDYCKEGNWYLVDPVIFWKFFDANEWHDSNDKPVKRWKGKVVTWHSFEEQRLKARGAKLTCRVCSKAAAYQGVDDTGQKYFLCEDHKPQAKEVPDIVKTIKFGEVPSGRVNKNNRVNELKDQLGA